MANKIRKRSFGDTFDRPLKCIRTRSLSFERNREFHLDRDILELAVSPLAQTILPVYSNIFFCTKKAKIRQHLY
jgi:hypothetical protein